MLDRAPLQTPRQRAAFERRSRRVMLRLRQRWASAFRRRLVQAQRRRRGALGLLGELRRMVRFGARR